MSRMVWSPSAVSVASMTPSGTSWGARQNLEPTWGLAHVHATRAVPSARKETCTELTTLTQITFHLAEPAGETAGIGER